MSQHTASAALVTLPMAPVGGRGGRTGRRRPPRRGWRARRAHRAALAGLASREGGIQRKRTSPMPRHDGKRPNSDKPWERANPRTARSVLRLGLLPSLLCFICDLDTWLRDASRRLTGLGMADDCQEIHPSVYSLQKADDGYKRALTVFPTICHAS